jgi:uncharacterized membrane protein
VTGFATIVFNSRGWLPLILTLIVGIGAALIWAGHRSEITARIRFGCGLLKLAGVLTLAICLLEPLLIGQRARPGANVFAIVADNSQSLQIKDSGQPQSRGEMVREELTKDKNGWLAALAENFQVRRYSFDARLQDIRDFGELNFDGRASALVNSLRTATERWRGQPVAGVLLFTDGNATDDSPDLSGLEGCPPVYPVVIGEDTELRDVSLDKMMVSQTAFEDAPVTVQAEVGAHGFGGSKVAARLVEVATSAPDSETNQTSAGNPRVVAEQSQSAGANDSSLNFRFQIQPDKPGLHFYELDTRVQEELNSPATQSREATLVNNRRIAVVDRGQEPFRILYVGGRPNWEFKFLNRALEDDPQVKMVSLLRIARREPKFEFKSRDGESSNPLFRGFGDTNSEDIESYDQPVLIRLNTKDEFELRGGFPKTAEELFRYHAVIIGDMESDFFTHDQMVLLQQFVSERGGGLLMLGGAESFREGKYAETVVGSMLPVYLDQTFDTKVSDHWKLTLTREGWLQPWTRLRATEAEEQMRLDSVPPLKVLNSVRGIKPGASVLATVSDGENRFPALVVQRFGAGRTAAVLIGDMWRWGMMDDSLQKDRAKSWRQLVRWLVSDVPSRVAVTPEPSVDGNSSEVRLVVSAKDETFKPIDNATVQLTVRPVALFQPGAASELSKSASTNYIQFTADASPNRPGTYEATYIARDAGAYLVEAHVTQPDGQVVGQASAGWASDPSAEEFRSLKPNRAFLETLAKQTGGEVLKLNELKSFVSHLPERRAPVTEPWSEPLWQKPFVLLFAFGCFLTEWGVRRWKGLP